VARAEGPAASGAVLSMDWDDEELSTQIYDRPEDQSGGYAPVHGGYEQGGYEQGGYEQGGYEQGGYEAVGAPAQAAVPTCVPPQGFAPDMGGGVHVSPSAYPPAAVQPSPFD